MASNASARLHAIAAELKAQGDRQLMREMTGTLRTAGNRLVPSVEQAAREQLPKEGGLNELVAGRHTTVSVLTARASTAGVRLRRARKDAASYQTNRGYIFHKTFGEKPWRRQEIPEAAGWWSDTLSKKSWSARPLIIATLDSVAERIART